ncbi:Major cardiolipin synthase ClsA [Gemmata sp. SH-PL17]|uniref:cardiolipin synthase n=1 Tax=Gemmata sp. SH-PL17 TaxID=1630693 RepID=UPI0004B21574|nr:cardiolipin synthase [Gemmata sp. SH-PL17]AMV25086.1 Major cardiolipin synthase ClsA [Gemmata sp. SH-PL17]
MKAPNEPYSLELKKARMSLSDFLVTFWQDIAGWLVLAEVLLTVGTLLAVMHIKREPMSAIAWSLTVLLVPFFGAFLFLVFGYQTVHRRLRRRRERSRVYKTFTARTGGPSAGVPPEWDVLAKLGHHGDGFPVTGGNAIALYHEGNAAFEAMLEAIESARHHVHAQFFICHSDDTGKRFIDALRACAKRGVEVRFLVDWVGSYGLSSRLLRELKADGGQVASFLPLVNPLRVNLRNHRKILVVDGHTGFAGGLNIGDEYLSKCPTFGYWRDTHFRVAGPAVEGLQHTFLDDWYFTTNEAVKGGAYFPASNEKSAPGTVLAQVVASGPDAEYKAIRETYVAAILRARKRVWIASPYFVPDAGLRDALLLAARSGVDVRLLGLCRPDKWLPFLAARYYWTDMLAAGVKVYQYTRGMLHSKLVIVDDEWASVGSANTDNRSLLLNFECNVQFFDTGVVKGLEEAYLIDLEWSLRLDPEVYATRPFVGRLAENACRLFSPVL